MDTSSGWQFWIDRGGTFTDIVAKRPDGSLVTHKLLSEKSRTISRRRGCRHPPLLGVEDERAHSVERIEAVKMGTTVATNALLERQGRADGALHHERLRRRAANRLSKPPAHLRPRNSPAELLYKKVVEVAERIGARGDVMTPLDEPGVRADLEAVYADGFRGVAMSSCTAIASRNTSDASPRWRVNRLHARCRSPIESAR